MSDDVLTVRIAHERELREQAERYVKEQLDKQAVEYSRRLDELNGAHERALQDRTELLRKETYESMLKELAAWREGIVKEMASERARVGQSQRATTMAMSALMVLLAILNLIAWYFRGAR